MSQNTKGSQIELLCSESSLQGFCNESLYALPEDAKLKYVWKKEREKVEEIIGQDKHQSVGLMWSEYLESLCSAHIILPTRFRNGQLHMQRSSEP